MRNVYVIADNIFSPLGETTMANMTSLKQGLSGVQLHNSALSPDPFFASLFAEAQKPVDNSLPLFESIVLASARDAMQHVSLDPKDPATGFILSTTKGNVSLIEDSAAREISADRLSLSVSARV